jgi:hypothetical protein
LSAEGDTDSSLGTPDLTGEALNPVLRKHQIEGEGDVGRACHFEARAIGGEITDDAIDGRPVPMEDDLRRLQAAKTWDSSPFGHWVSSSEMRGDVAQRTRTELFPQILWNAYENRFL